MKIIDLKKARTGRVGLKNIITWHNGDTQRLTSKMLKEKFYGVKRYEVIDDTQAD